MDITKLLEIYEKQSTIADTAREYCKLNNVEYNDSVRRKVSKILNKHAVVLESVTVSSGYKK